MRFQPESRRIIFIKSLLYYTFISSIFSFLSFNYFNCSKTQNDSQEPVAKIGDKIITADEFLKSYSFGPSVLKNTEDPKLQFLEAMINEELLFAKLENENIPLSQNLKREMRLLEQELIVEEVFKDQVNKNIKVSEDEIYSAISKSSHKVKVKYFYTSSLEDAEEKLRELNRGVSFDSLVASRLFNIGLSAEHGETDFIDYGELQEPFNEIIFTLKPGEISDIIATNKGYYILKNSDVRREILSSTDYSKYYKRYKKILENKKGMELAREFVKDFMDSKNIVVKGPSFSILVNSFYPVYKTSQNDVVLKQLPHRISDIEINSISRNISEYCDETLVEFAGGNWKISDFLDQLSYRPVYFDTHNMDSFAESVKKSLAIILRDYFIEKDGRNRNVHKRQEFIAELRRWKKKYTVEEHIQAIRSGIKVETEEVINYYHDHIPQNIPCVQIESRLRDLLIAKKILEILRENLIEIKSTVSVEIDHNNLDGIVVDEPRVGKLPDIKLFKLGIPYFREAIPTVSPIWAAESLVSNNR